MTAKNLTNSQGSPSGIGLHEIFNLLRLKKVERALVDVLRLACVFNSLGE